MVEDYGDKSGEDLRFTATISSKSFHMPVHEEKYDSVSYYISIYLIGTGAAVAGALGLAGAIELTSVLSAVLLFAGLATVVFVHHYLDGPL